MSHLLIRNYAGTDEGVAPRKRPFLNSDSSGQATFEPVLENLAFFQSILDSVPIPVAVLDAALHIRLVNHAFCEAFSVCPARTVSWPMHELRNGPCSGDRHIQSRLNDVLSGTRSLEEYPIAQELPEGERRSLLLTARPWTPSPSCIEPLLLLSFGGLTTTHQSVEMSPPFQALQKAYDRERHIAEEFERPLIQEIREDAFPGLSLATVYEAASEEADVGGDFFDAFALPRGLVALAVADASGKGLEAAVRTLQVKNVLRAFSREYPFCPNQILSRLNDFVCDTLRYDDGDEGYYFGGFVCITLAILDPRTGEGNIVSAGCEPPAILRRDGTIESMRSHGLPLGIQRESLYQMTPLHLSCGDTLLFTTDGVTEARRQRTRDFLGYSGMLEFAQKHRNEACVRHMALAILEGARSFADGVLRDDACLLIARKADI